MTEPKFKIGQSVYLGSDRRARIRNPYRITRVLPVEGGDQQYRIKSTREAHERVVPEAQLDEIAASQTDRRPTAHAPVRAGTIARAGSRDQGRSQAEALWAEISGPGLPR